MLYYCGCLSDLGTLRLVVVVAVGVVVVFVNSMAYYFTFTLVAAFTLQIAEKNLGPWLHALSMNVFMYAAAE